MSNNRLCIVLPCYNRRQFLEQAIQSVLAQTEPAFDLIVCDNASTDGSWELIQSTQWNVKGRVELVRNESNLGAVGSARRWSKMIVAPWTTILSDDDWLAPTFVEHVLPHLSDPPRGLVVVGHARTTVDGTVTHEYCRAAETLAAIPSLYQFERHELEVAGISGYALPSNILRASSFPRGYPGGFCEDGMICIEALLNGGATCLAGVDYFRRDWAGGESQRADRFANQGIAYARFAKDVTAAIVKSGLRLERPLLWQRRPLVSYLAFFGRAILEHNLPFSEFRRYFRFALGYGPAEVGRACLVAMIFLLRVAPIRALLREYDSRRRLRLYGRQETAV